jgi:hypothetical protein
MAVTANNIYQFSIYGKTDTSGSGVWKVMQAEIKWYDGTGGGAALVSTSTVPITLGTSYGNTATPFTAPATAAGATIVLTAVRDSTVSYDSTVLAYFDNISLSLLTTSRSIKFLPNVTLTDGPLDFSEIATPSTPASGILSLSSSSSDHGLHTVDSYGADRVIEKTIQQHYTLVTNTVSETPIITATIKANSMGASGRIVQHAEAIVKNNKGSAGTITVKFYFGSYSFTFYSGVTVNNSATTRTILIYNVEVRNIGATNSQEIILTDINNQNVAAATRVANTFASAWDTSSIDTTADQTMKITITLSAASTSFFCISSGGTNGPHQ